MPLPPGTREWFGRVRKELPRYFGPLCGQRIVYVEIGCWVGGSAEWACEHLLTHRFSRGFGIDPYEAMGARHPQWQMDAVKEYAAQRLATFGRKWKWLYGKSADRLKDWRHGQIDALYIDGDHTAEAVINDFRLALPHLSREAIVVFDDYGCGLHKSDATVPAAVHLITQVLGSHVRVLGHAKQYAIQMNGSPPSLTWPDAIPTWTPIVRAAPLPPEKLTAQQRRAGRIQRRARLARARAGVGAIIQ